MKPRKQLPMICPIQLHYHSKWSDIVHSKHKKHWNFHFHELIKVILFTGNSVTFEHEKMFVSPVWEKLSGRIFFNNYILNIVCNFSRLGESCVKIIRCCESCVVSHEIHVWWLWRRVKMNCLKTKLMITFDSFWIIESEFKFYIWVSRFSSFCTIRIWNVTEKETEIFIECFFGWPFDSIYFVKLATALFATLI